jgi:hypothetical protein
MKHLPALVAGVLLVRFVRGVRLAPPAGRPK